MALLLALLLYVQSQACDGSLMKHVFHPSRLIIKKGCITVKGTIRSEKDKPDGDMHVLVQLDPGQATDLVNAKNLSRQHGFLIVEVICQRPSSQSSAERACRDFKQNIKIPPIGTHVSITGVHVLDKDHGWLEIHPVTSIKVQ
jgi:hypothetical protein